MHIKAKYLISQLQALGVHDWQCAVAVMQCGSNLEGCVAFLLEDIITSEEDLKADVLPLIAGDKSENSFTQLAAGAQAHKGQVPDQPAPSARLP